MTYQSGDKNPSWRGGKLFNKGYLMVLIPNHPRADTRGYVKEHILRAEKALGKPLPLGAVVHHADGSKTGPLVICQDDNYHRFLHQRLRAFIATGDVNKRKCSYCKKYDDLSILKKNGSGFYHTQCATDYSRLNYPQNRERILAQQRARAKRHKET